MELISMQPDNKVKIFFDTETTGLEPNNGDRLVEIGCIEIILKTLTRVTYFL